MNVISIIQTRDGVEFKNYILANQHAEKLVSDKVYKIASDIKSCVKLADIVQFIMENLSEFSELSDLNNDLTLFNEDGEKVPDTKNSVREYVPAVRYTQRRPKTKDRVK